MAELLGTILIKSANVNLVNFSVDDVIKVTYDVDTNAIVVTNNDIAILEAASDILIFLRYLETADGLVGVGVYWNRTDTGFTTVVDDYDGSGDNVTISFVPSQSFPYYIKNVYINPVDPTEGDVNDIAISLVSTTNASDTVTSDGVIVVSATGTNTPILYSFNEPAPNYGQSSGTFSNLPRGSYTIFAVDNLGYSVSIAVTLLSDDEPYGVRWRTGWKDQEGQEGKLDILERSYSSSITEVKGGAIPFTHSTRGEARDIVDLSIISSQVDITVLATTLDQFIDIANADDGKYKVIVYKDVASSFVETWRGYINPESFADTPNGTPYPVSFTATDRVADLSSRHFLFNEEYIKGGTNQYVTGDMSQLAVLKICLDKTKLAQGYRIACNFFDAGHTPTVVSLKPTSSSLVQTYINTDVYHGEDKVSMCSDVIKDILSIYGAILVSWAGYWYIIRTKELLQTSVDYIEYDTDLTYVGTGSWSPRIDFKDTDLLSRYRWVGGMSRIMSSVFRKVILTINTVVKEGGLTPAINESNATFINGNFVSINPFVLWNYGSASQSLRKIGDADYWSLTTSARTNASSFIQWNENITYSTNDQAELDIGLLYNVGFSDTDTNKKFDAYPPYLILKWSLALGSQFLTSDGNWVNTDPENQFFLTNFNTDTDLKLKFDLPTGNTTEETLTLKVYPINFYESDAQGTFSLDIVSIPTVDLNLGDRRVLYYVFGDNDVLAYYQLRNDTEIDGEYAVEPIDYHVTTNPRKWVYINGFSHPHTSGSVSVNLKSATNFSHINLNFFPEGNDIPEEVITYNTNEIKNKVDYEKEINLFDLDGNFNNDEKIFLNYTKLSDGTPTTVWNEMTAGVAGTITKTSQTWLVDWLQRLTKKTRMIVSGTFFTDVEYTPINVLNDPDDNNRVFYPNGISSDIKARQYNGEVIEIGGDNAPTTSAFDSSIDQDQYE